MGLRMKNFNTSGVYRKIPFLGLEVHKSRGGIAAKGGVGFGQFSDLRGGLDKEKAEVVFLRTV